MNGVKHAFRQTISLLLCVTLLAGPMACGRRQTPPTTPLAPAVFNPLQEALKTGYLYLFRTSKQLEFSPEQIAAMRGYLSGARDYCIGQFKKRSDQYEFDMNQAQAELKRTSVKLNEAERHALHCKIQNLRELRSETKVLADHGIPTAFQNKEAAAATSPVLSRTCNPPPGVRSRCTSPWKKTGDWCVGSRMKIFVSTKKQPV